jgi:dTDP-4-dehydrorhamnose reductase
LAEQLAALCQTDAYGTYHATSQGQCSWFDFAAEIFRQSGLSPSLSPQTTAESGAKAIRPSFSVLENRALKDLDLDQMTSWQNALARYLAERQAGQS